jgi:hypothetical protein
MARRVVFLSNIRHPPSDHRTSGGSFSIRWTIRVTVQIESCLEHHTGGIVAFLANAASMGHAAKRIRRKAGFAVANR